MTRFDDNSKRDSYKAPEAFEQYNTCSSKDSSFRDWQSHAHGRGNPPNISVADRDREKSNRHSKEWSVRPPSNLNRTPKIMDVPWTEVKRSGKGGNTPAHNPTAVMKPTTTAAKAKQALAMDNSTSASSASSTTSTSSYKDALLAKEKKANHQNENPVSSHGKSKASATEATGNKQIKQQTNLLHYMKEKKHGITGAPKERITATPSASSPKRASPSNTRKRLQASETPEKGPKLHDKLEPGTSSDREAIKRGASRQKASDPTKNDKTDPKSKKETKAVPKKEIADLSPSSWPSSTSSDSLEASVSEVAAVNQREENAESINSNNNSNVQTDENSGVAGTSSGSHDSSPAVESEASTSTGSSAETGDVASSTSTGSSAETGDGASSTSTGSSVETGDVAWTHEDLRAHLTRNQCSNNSKMTRGRLLELAGSTGGLPSLSESEGNKSELTTKQIRKILIKRGIKPAIHTTSRCKLFSMFIKSGGEPTDASDSEEEERSIKVEVNAEDSEEEEGSNEVEVNEEAEQTALRMHSNFNAYLTGKKNVNVDESSISSLEEPLIAASSNNNSPLRSSKSIEYDAQDYYVYEPEEIIDNPETEFDSNESTGNLLSPSPADAEMETSSIQTSGNEYMTEVLGQMVGKNETTVKGQTLSTAVVGATIRVANETSPTRQAGITYTPCPDSMNHLLRSTPDNASQGYVEHNATEISAYWDLAIKSKEEQRKFRKGEEFKRRYDVVINDGMKDGGIDIHNTLGIYDINKAAGSNIITLTAHHFDAQGDRFGTRNHAIFLKTQSILEKCLRSCYSNLTIVHARASDAMSPLSHPILQTDGTSCGTKAITAAVIFSQVPIGAEKAVFEKYLSLYDQAEVEKFEDQWTYGMIPSFFQACARNPDPNVSEYVRPPVPLLHSIRSQVRTEAMARQPPVGGEGPGPPPLGGADLPAGGGASARGPSNRQDQRGHKNSSKECRKKPCGVLNTPKWPAKPYKSASATTPFNQKPRNLPPSATNYRPDELDDDDPDLAGIGDDSSASSSDVQATSKYLNVWFGPPPDDVDPKDFLCSKMQSLAKEAFEVDPDFEFQTTSQLKVSPSQISKSTNQKKEADQMWLRFVAVTPYSMQKVDTNSVDEDGNVRQPQPIYGTIKVTTSLSLESIPTELFPITASLDLKLFSKKIQTLHSENVGMLTGLHTDNDPEAVKDSVERGLHRYTSRKGTPDIEVSVSIRPIKLSKTHAANSQFANLAPSVQKLHRAFHLEVSSSRAAEVIEFFAKANNDGTMMRLFGGTSGFCSMGRRAKRDNEAQLFQAQQIQHHHTLQKHFRVATFHGVHSPFTVFNSENVDGSTSKDKKLTLKQVLMSVTGSDTAEDKTRSKVILAVLRPRTGPNAGSTQVTYRNDARGTSDVNGGKLLVNGPYIHIIREMLKNPSYYIAHYMKDVLHLSPSTIASGLRGVEFDYSITWWEQSSFNPQTRELTVSEAFRVSSPSNEVTAAIFRGYDLTEPTGTDATEDKQFIFDARIKHPDQDRRVGGDGASARTNATNVSSVAASKKSTDPQNVRESYLRSKKKSVEQLTDIANKDAQILEMKRNQEEMARIIEAMRDGGNDSAIHDLLTKMQIEKEPSTKVVFGTSQDAADSVDEKKSDDDSDVTAK